MSACDGPQPKVNDDQTAFPRRVPRAALVALCLFLVQAFVVAPHARAAALTPIWGAIPGDSYRVGVRSFSAPLRAPRDAAGENPQWQAGASRARRRRGSGAR